MTATDVGQEKAGRGMGARLLRKEDARLLTGEAQYVDDLHIPGALWMGMVRSPFAHARIGNIDASAALAMPGVRHVFTGEDLRDDWAAAMPCAWPVTGDMKAPDHWPVAVGKACYMGDIVAVVVAESRYQVADAVDAVVVDYDPLEATADLEDAASDRVVIHDGLGTNRSYTWTLSPDPDAVERAFAEAAHVVNQRYVQQRLIPEAMETRGVAVVPGVYGGDLTIFSATQIPHILKVMVAATCGVAEHKIRVVAPSVGGAFGSKLNVYAEE
ncbi:MAG TPA: molybdopterin cofactor-binding domain-containing protein, partial [Actinomycetota bacterium]|nr:molybdopterin cofactor-binding domain-containing protein [Actinomycetota bacterium]